MMILDVETFQASENKRIEYGRYHFIYEVGDSVLVRMLLEKVSPKITELEKFFGYKPGSVITICIACSDKAFRAATEDAVPEWAQAVAHIRRRLIVMKLDDAEQIKRSPQVLMHELAHMFIAQRLNDEQIPVWLNEGIAEYISRAEFGLDEKVMLANALQSKSILPLSALDSLFNFRKPKARLAYAEAYSAVQYFISQFGEIKIQELLQNLGMYSSVNDAFLATIGYDQIDFEIMWYQDIYDRLRWLVILNFDNVFWVIIGILFVLAIIIVKIKNRKIIRGWDEDDHKII